MSNHGAQPAHWQAMPSVGASEGGDEMGAGRGVPATDCQVWAARQRYSVPHSHRSTVTTIGNRDHGGMIRHQAALHCLHTGCTVLAQAVPAANSSTRCTPTMVWSKMRTPSI
jgi:hypothetical protein